MTELLAILQLARNDFSYFFRTKWLMAVLLSLNLSDMLVVALVYKQIIPLSKINYFQFFVPAVIVMGMFAAALDTGRRIWLAIREGVIQYYLSLPISTPGHCRGLLACRWAFCDGLLGFALARSPGRSSNGGCR